MNELILYVDNVETRAPEVIEPLVRAVIISLFTWRRANKDDELPNGDRQGWWGDTYPDVNNDQIGSRLWLLTRAKLTTETVNRAKEYAEESLKWLIDDTAAVGVDVYAERQGIERLALQITITRGDLTTVNLRFADVWNYINGI